MPPAFVDGYEWRDAEKGAMGGGVDVASANLQDSDQPRLARAPRRGLPGPRPQVLPTRFASRAVRRNPASRLFPRPGMKPRHSLCSALPARSRRASPCGLALPPAGLETVPVSVSYRTAHARADASGSGTSVE